MADRIIPLNGRVICDIDSTDLTNDPRSGGFIFGSYGVGPCCAERFMADIKKTHEEDHITATCPPGMRHCDWIRELRAQTGQGDNIVIRGGGEFADHLADDLGERFNA